MVNRSTPLDSREDREIEIEPRCSRCERNVPGEWVNWQKCWSAPYRGAADEPRILAHTSVCPGFDDPIMLRLQNPAEHEGISFWWIFYLRSM